MSAKSSTNGFISILLFSMLFSFLAINDARAAQVSAVVKGHLEYVGDELSGTFSIGDLFHLEYTFDSTTADSVLGDPNLGIYVDSISALSVKIGNYSAVGNGRSHINISDNVLYIDGNNNNLYIDQYRIDLIDQMIGDSVKGYDLATFQSALLSLTDLSGNSFSNDALVTYALDLYSFQGYLALSFYNPHFGRTGIQADVSYFKVSSVPIPSAFWIMLSGLITLFGVTKIKRQR